MAYEKPRSGAGERPQVSVHGGGHTGDDLDRKTPVPPAEADRRSAVGCAWWWWVAMLVLLAVLIWMWFGWWRTTPPAATGPTPDQPPVTAPGEPTLPPPGQPPG
jgi:hypothetical protein